MLLGSLSTALNSNQLTTVSLVEVGVWDVQGLPPMAQPAPRENYATMAGKPAPPAMSPHANGTRHLSLIYQCKNKGGRDGGKRMIQRLN